MSKVEEADRGKQEISRDLERLHKSLSNLQEIVCKNEENLVKKIEKLVRLQTSIEASLKNGEEAKLPDEYKTYLDLVQELEPVLKNLELELSQSFESSHKLAEDLEKDRRLVRNMIEENPERPDIPDYEEDFNIEK